MAGWEPLVQNIPPWWDDTDLTAIENALFAPYPTGVMKTLIEKTFSTQLKTRVLVDYDGKVIKFEKVDLDPAEGAMTGSILSVAESLKKSRVALEQLKTQIESDKENPKAQELVLLARKFPGLKDRARIANKYQSLDDDERDQAIEDISCWGRRRADLLWDVGPGRTLSLLWTEEERAAAKKAKIMARIAEIDSELNTPKSLKLNRKEEVQWELSTIELDAEANALKSMLDQLE